jgi:hypothetical protein
MEQKHSPLPWRISNQGDKFSIKSRDELFIVSQLGMANAQFIVRACNAHEELLEAMKKVEEMIYDSDNKTARNAAEILQAVISKVEKCGK